MRLAYDDPSDALYKESVFRYAARVGGADFTNYYHNYYYGAYFTKPLNLKMNRWSNGTFDLARGGARAAAPPRPRR
eukprot:SAG31_NODE_30322_length_382_cov_2.310954_1_plen_75_part_01